MVVIASVTEMLFADNAPVTDKVPASSAFATDRFCKPAILVMFAFTTLIAAAVTLPVTVRFVRVPTVVILGWLPVVNVPLIVFVLMLLVTVRFCNPLRLLMLAVVAVNKSVVN